MPIEFWIISFGVLVAGLGTWIAGRASIGSGGFWPAAWAVVLIGVLADRFAASPLAVSLGHLLGTVFAGLILAGAIRFVGRPLPSWLLPTAVLLGIARAGLAAMDAPRIAGAIALIPEPAAELTAAFLVTRYSLTGSVPIQQRLLGPALALLAALDVWTGLIAFGGWDRAPLVLPWMVCAAFISLLQLTTFLAQLQHRIRDRTAELARRNSELTAEIAERIGAEEALRVSEDRYRKLSRLNSDFSFVVRVLESGGHEVVWIAGAFERITGYSVDEAEELGWLGIVHPDDLESLLEHFRPDGSGRPMSHEFRIVCKDASIRWVEQHVQLEVDEPTATIMIYGATHDITWRKQAEAERERLEARIREAQRLESLGVLAGGVAHDFNNLLTVILGNTAMVLADLDEASPHRERLARIRKTAEYAADLAGQMLDYSGSTVLVSKPLDLSRLAEDMVGLLQDELPPNVQLRLDFAHELPFVDGDDTRLRQVVLNLVTNAAEALGEAGGTLSVSTGSMRVDPDYLEDAMPGGGLDESSAVYLEVRDDGPGMDPSTRDHIFEPFYTTKSLSPGRKGSGRGLGLAAVLGIVRAHRGVIKIETAVGEGTCFRVLFPKRVAALPDAVPTRRAAVDAASSATILLIDDDEMVREVGFEFLRRAGFEVLLAASGREGLQQLDAHGDEISLVLLDFVMPDLDGETVLREIRERRPELPIVAVTGYSQAEGRLGRLQLSGYLEKPYDPDVLVALVREGLERS